MTDNPEPGAPNDVYPCKNPPCEQVGPFRYCPIKGCNWGEPSNLTVVDIRCSLERCSKNIYRMVGSCINCGADNLLLLITEGHEAPRSMYEATCPICGCRKVVARRLATPEEIPS